MQQVKAIGYARVSTDRQADEGESIAVQRELIEAAATQRKLDGVLLVDTLVEHASAKDANRPRLRELRGMIARREIDAVIVYRLDRLSRRVSDLTAMIDEFGAAGVALISVKESIDMTTPMGRAMIGMIGVFAALEREVIAERVTDALAARKAEGRVAGHPEYGKRRGEDKAAIDNADERAVIDRMRALRAEGKAYEAIAHAVTAEGIRTRRGRPFSRQGVHHLLKKFGYQDG